MIPGRLCLVAFFRPQRTELQRERIRCKKRLLPAPRLRWSMVRRGHGPALSVGGDALTSLQNCWRSTIAGSCVFPFLAITGSNGKTTTKELVRGNSRRSTRHCDETKTNNHISVPLTILSITDEIEFAVIEMGANHQQEIASYCRSWDRPGLITNVGKGAS